MSDTGARQDADLIADVLWWLKGYRAGLDSDTYSDIDATHDDALRRARIRLLKQIAEEAGE